MTANLSMPQEHPFVFHLVQATLWGAGTWKEMRNVRQFPSGVERHS